MKLLTPVIKCPLPTIEDINAFEKLNDICIPRDYKEFLLTQNVFYVKENYYKSVNGIAMGVAKKFFQTADQCEYKNKEFRFVIFQLKNTSHF